MTIPQTRGACAALAALILIAACGDDPLRPALPADDAPASHSLEPAAGTARAFPLVGVLAEYGAPAAAAAAAATAAQGPPGGYPLVIVRAGPGAAAPTTAGVPVVDSFEAALARVAPGGTIRVAGGIHTVPSVVVDRPVTIEPQGNARPVIQGVPGPPTFDVQAVPGGTVRFRNLHFELPPGARSAIMARIAYDQVAVEGCSFVLAGGSSGDQQFAVEAGFNPGGGTVWLTGGTVRGGTAGAFAWGDGALVVRASTFRDQVLAAVQYQSQARGRVEGSDLADCGLAGCVRVLGSMADVIDNILTQTRTDVTGQTHQVVLYSLLRLVDGSWVGPAGGTVRGNRFHGCGSGLCMLVTNGADVDVLGNEFRVPAAHGTRGGIVGSFNAHVRILDNDVRGLGGDPTHPDGQAIGFGSPGGVGISVQDGATAVLFRNEVVNAHFGINVTNGGHVTAGADNVVRQVFHGIMIGGGPQLNVPPARAVHLRRSNFTEYVNAIAGIGTPEPSDLRCNWWGSPDGPVLRDFGFGNPADPGLYQPWAMQPIAGNSGAVCPS
jgi:hypothetical protein